MPLILTRLPPTHPDFCPIFGAFFADGQKGRAGCSGRMGPIGLGGALPTKQLIRPRGEKRRKEKPTQCKHGKKGGKMRGIVGRILNIIWRESTGDWEMIRPGINDQQEVINDRENDRINEVH